MKRKAKSDCPIFYSLSVFGDKWTLLILRDLLIRRKRLSQDFLKSEEKIATNILADRLQKIQEYGLVTKTDNPEDKRYTIYTPTAKAVALLPVIGEMAKWGLRFGDKKSDAFLKRLVNDPEGVRKELREFYKKEFEELEKG
jgi:DNA-binding HxlR family transcriptional regulator